MSWSGLRLAAAVLTFCSVAYPAAAQTKTRAANMHEAAMALVSVKSDRNLNDLRFGCAAGTARDFMARQKEAGNAYTTADLLCLAVLKEAAIKRPNTMHLYSDLQPARAFDEWNLIVAAAGKDRPEYLNVDAKTKSLSCELALDAGYIYGLRNRQQTIAPELSDADTLKSATDCYNGAAHVSPRAALTAGARIAQMHAK